MTANDMIAKLTDTLQAIEKADSKSDTVENLKMSIAPDAATLISQGVSLVLETHEYNSELSAAVMKIQTTLKRNTGRCNTMGEFSVDWCVWTVD